MYMHALQCNCRSFAIHLTPLNPLYLDPKTKNSNIKVKSTVIIKILLVLFVAFFKNITNF